MGNHLFDKKITVRIWGSFKSSRIEFYEIIKQKTKTQYYVQKLQSKLLFDCASICSFYIPTNIKADEIKLIKKDKVGFRFEKFQYKTAKSNVETLNFQEGEEQFEWDGYPIILVFDRDLYIDMSPDLYMEIEKNIQKYLHSIERVKKLKKLNSIQPNRGT